MWSETTRAVLRRPWGMQGEYATGVLERLTLFTDLDGVRKHACYTIEPRDQVARSGWVGFCQ
jgi:hypothetical protein